MAVETASGQWVAVGSVSVARPPGCSEPTCPARWVRLRHQVCTLSETDDTWQLLYGLQTCLPATLPGGGHGAHGPLTCVATEGNLAVAAG